MKTNEIIINCSTLIESKRVKWKTYIKSVIFYCDYYEAVVEGEGREFTIIVGTTTNYNWIALPNQRLSCTLSKFDDVFWNSDHLGEMLGIIDATTIAEAIAYIDKNKETLEKR